MVTATSVVVVVQAEETLQAGWHLCLDACRGGEASMRSDQQSHSRLLTLKERGREGEGEEISTLGIKK